MHAPNESLPLFPPGHALQALRSGPYKDSSHALAEIVDNSCDAEATNIHVAIICEGKDSNLKPQYIATFDNGKGMGAKKLQEAVQYGMGENIEQNIPNKFGRFGVGLLASTFSQCNSLRIWSWQNGIDERDGSKSAFTVSINTKSDVVHAPEILPLPEYFDEIFFDGDNPAKGTLVEWQNFHSLSWKKPITLVDNLAFECGRIYRNLILSGKLKIELSIRDISYKVIGERVRQVEAVDPLFLTNWRNKALNAFSSEKTLFEPWAGGGDQRLDEEGKPTSKKHPVRDDSSKLIGHYSILASHRRIPDVVKKSREDEYQDPGSAPYGILARKLRGVSILREGRELILDPKWLPPDQSTPRWLGISIDFDASLDEIFGVDNTKQAARYLSELAGLTDWEINEKAANLHVAEAAMKIRKLIYAMNRELKKEQKGSRSTGAHTPTRRVLSNVSIGEHKRLTEFSEYRQEHGNNAPSDQDDPKSDPDQLAKSFEGALVDSPDGSTVWANKVAPKHIIDNDLRVYFVREPNLGGQFFDVKESQGVVRVVLNQDHPLYSKLSDTSIAMDENSTVQDRPLGLEQVNEVVWVIQMLLYSFARAECEAGSKKDEFQSTRLAWGRVVKALLQYEE